MLSVLLKELQLNESSLWDSPLVILSVSTQFYPEATGLFYSVQLVRRPLNCVDYPANLRLLFCRSDIFLIRMCSLSFRFCYTGVLLRKLESGISGISHIIIDEIHERDINVSSLNFLFNCNKHTTI